MRAGKLGRWVVRLVAVAAFGAAAAIAGVAVANTDEPEPQPWEEVDPSSSPVATPDEATWN